MAFEIVGPHHVHTLWVPSDGSPGTVVVEGTNDHEVIYTAVDGTVHCCNRVEFSRNFMLADDMPSDEDEEQDFMGSDDNFLDHMVDIDY